MNEAYGGHWLQPGHIDVSHGPILYVEDLSVVFDGFRAINQLNLSIDDGELRCVIGPNGAGKTTLMDVITGKTRSPMARISGSVFLGQTMDLRRMKEAAIAQAGIGRKFQKPTVFEEHKVWENLDIAMAGNKHWWATLRARLGSEERARIEQVLEQTGLESQAYERAGTLSHGQKQRLEIGMLLMQQPRLLLLDEPVAGMSDHESMELADLLGRLRGGCSIMVVEHDMDFVAALAGDSGKVTVLAEGRTLAEGTLSQIRENPRVVESYLGR
ncbi:urea ABC transporter ATP-binding protein UrtD [Comamonas composti]|uniref:urea ABC transporter ATP-binding protein UrtD n=1 Tax=Comamonas composti TaxID=408558 RepID=UPI00040954EF|nr:urea ABC transporter ATP-binding protein UrtD [Comamonas composti]